MDQDYYHYNPETAGVVKPGVYYSDLVVVLQNHFLDSCLKRFMSAMISVSSVQTENKQKGT